MASACCTSPCIVLQTRQQALESKDLTDLTNEAKYNFQKPWQVVKIIGQADTTEQLDLLAHPFHSFAFAQGSQRHRNLAAGIGNVRNKNQQAKQDPKSGGILWKSMNRNEPKMNLIPNHALPASNQILASSGAKSKAPNTSGETQNLGVLRCKCCRLCSYWLFWFGRTWSWPSCCFMKGSEFDLSMPCCCFRPWPFAISVAQLVFFLAKLCGVSVPWIKIACSCL